MTFNKIFLFCVILVINILPQNTLFVKYKSNINKDLVEQIVQNKSIFPSTNKSISKSDIKVDFLAHKIAFNDDVLSRIIKVTFNSNEQLNDAVSTLNSDPDVEYVEVSHTLKVDFIPNDSLINEQWALAKVEAYKAWDITQGSDSIVIGLVDTGIDYNHPDIKNKIFINKGETGLDSLGRDKRTNGVDDDHNGFIDDYMGWDFVDRAGFPFDSTGGKDYLNWDNDPMDEYFHGTFVSGIIGAQTNNTSGIAGVAPNIKILNVRAFDPEGNGEEDDAAAAIIYAVKMGAKVINMSFGDDKFSYVLRDVIQYAYENNVVLVASSGNQGSNLPHYPSGYSQVISVGNSTSDDFVSSDSNYGSTLDLVAPGSSILSLDLNGGYTVKSGTSASAPFVSAAAGLLLSIKNFSNEEVKQILKSTSDDILETGWDNRSGAGRLNIYKALTVAAPANIKFNFPTEDYALEKDSFSVNINVLSPYFVKYDLMIGNGLNPTTWNYLAKDIPYQQINANIVSINVNDYPAGDYTLRLLVQLTKGNATEERVNFHIIKSAPSIELVGIGPVYYGRESTVSGELYTDQNCITKMYYRKAGENQFNFVTLDGLATNNLFVKQYHYGFIPQNIISQDQDYEVYFVAENLAGIRTTLMDSTTNSYFKIHTDKPLQEIANVESSLSLPKGTLFPDPVNLNGFQKDQVLFNTFYTSSDLYYALFKVVNNKFVRQQVDSIKNKIPVYVDDINSDGLTDMLSLYLRTGYLDEQKARGVVSFNNFYSDSLNNKFYPAFAGHLFNNNSFQVVTNYDDKNYYVYQINNDLSVTLLDSLKNYSFIDSYDSNVDLVNNIHNGVVLSDLNNDGIKELWFVDQDGDVLSYNCLPNGKFSVGDSLITKFEYVNANCISAGDYDGDGVEDLAVLLNTESIQPSFMLLIFNFKNNNFNLISQKLFLDQSSEFKGFGVSNKVYQSLKLSDIDGDGKKELILNVFPYSYIFKYQNNYDQLVFYKEGVNTESIFAAPLIDSKPVVGLQFSDGYHFYTFSSGLSANVNNLKGYSLTKNSIQLSWQSTASKFYIYRGFDKNNLALLDSTTSQSYKDVNLHDSLNIFYALKALDNKNVLTDLSEIIDVYNHNPAKISDIKQTSDNSIEVIFDEKIKNTIYNLESFNIDNKLYPNSVSASSQYSYLLSFKDKFISGEHYLKVNDLFDLYDSPVKNDSIAFNLSVNPINKQLYVESYELINPYTIKIKYNLPVDVASAGNKANYSFEPENFIDKIENQKEDQSSVLIYLKNLRPVGSIGKEYILRISNVYSTDQEGKILINKEAGSYIVLSSYADNLNDVYVYPNPARINNNNSSITFANLPKKAKIYIFNLNGSPVSELEEKDGNGGLTFNLKDKNNNSLSSGIYIYRIVKLDDQNNEKEEKIGKFAVIR